MSYHATRPPLAAASLAVLLVLVALAPPAHAQSNFTAQLFGQAERPPVQTEAYGSCLGVLSADETLFTLSCEHTVEGASSARLRVGFADQTGPLAFDLGDPASPVQAEWNLDADDVVRLLAGDLYVDVASAGHPGGEIRGQLLASPPTASHVLRFPLSGDQEAPPVATTASGACFVAAEYQVTPFLPPNQIALHLRCAHDVPDATGAALVIGEPGEVGTTSFDLGDGASPIDDMVLLDSGPEVNAFLTRDLYVNVRSVSDPSGELRGQLAGCLQDAETLCFAGNRFQAKMNWTTATDAGAATGRPETLDSGLFWFFRPSNLEALVKVLDGCGVNDHYWVFLAATTNVGYQLRVTDTETGQTRTYSNTRGHDAQPKLDTAAFATCP